MADLALVQCQSCGGTYAPVQADGTLYFHACPSRRLVADAVLDDTGKVVTPAVFEKIANPRNENVGSIGEDGKALPISEGLGVAPVTDAAVLASFNAPTVEGL